MKIIIGSPHEIHGICQDLFEFAKEQTVWVFEGEMGAGKTTFIKAICRHLKVVDPVGSPTFSLVNVYENEQGEEVYHFDFYRIEKEMEAVDIGCDEYFYSGNYCFIEWAGRIPNLLPPKYLKISIKLDHENNRLIHLTHHE